MPILFAQYLARANVLVLCWGWGLTEPATLMRLLFRVPDDLSNIWGPMHLRQAMHLRLDIDA